MAIQRRPAPASSDTTQELLLAVNNGDLEALRSAMKRFSFKDEESVLRFALAVLAKSATRSLTITDLAGARVSLNPSSDLLASAETVTQS